MWRIAVVGTPQAAGWLRKTAISVQRPVKGLPCRRRATPFAKTLHRQHPDRAVERNRYHVLDPHRMAGGRDTLAIDAHEAAGHKLRRVAAGAHHPRMPQPFVDALAVG